MIGLSAITANPYFALAKYGTIVAVLCGTWVGGCHHGVVGEQRKAEAALSTARAARIEHYEEALAHAQAQHKADQEDDNILTLDLAVLREQRDKLSRVVVQLTSHKTEKPNAEGLCDRAVLSDAFGVCVTAFVSGDPGDAASCAARGSDGPVQPAVGPGGVPVPTAVLESDPGRAGGDVTELF